MGQNRKIANPNVPLDEEHWRKLLPIYLTFQKSFSTFLLFYIPKGK